VTAAVVLGAAAAPAAGQTRSWGLGIHTGWMETGSLGEAEPDDMDLKLDDGWTGGASLEWWFGSRRLGLRLDGAYTSQPYELQSAEHDPTWIYNDPSGEITVVTELDELGNVDTWIGDAALMLRLFEPDADNRFAPFVGLGGGFIRWDHEGDVDLAVNEADTYIQGDDQSEWVIAGSLGADFLLTDNVALRAELKDYWNPSSPYTFVTNRNDHQEGAHNQIASLGVQFMFGGERVSEPGFISVAPEPEPEPVVAAAPTTERVTMCVVDQAGRLELVSGTRHLATGDVYVTENGRDILFVNAHPVAQPVYVKGAPWYVAAEPLVLNLEADDLGGDVDDELDDAAENRVEFLNFGATQPLPTGDVLYVGSIDGTPLYATRSDIGDLLPDLEARLRVSRDLDDVLDDEEFATRFAAGIETFYTVVEPGTPAIEATTASCIFQPMSPTHVVRRTRG
jgi:hypothetical protein